MIHEGMLWFDDSDTRPITEKVERAAARYNQKYGHAPSVCYVHPADMAKLSDNGQVQVGDVKVLPVKSVMLNHFWLGTEGTSGQKTKSKSR